MGRHMQHWVGWSAHWGGLERTLGWAGAHTPWAADGVRPGCSMGRARLHMGPSSRQKWAGARSIGLRMVHTSSGPCTRPSGYP